MSSLLWVDETGKESRAYQRHDRLQILRNGGKYNEHCSRHACFFEFNLPPNFHFKRCGQPHRLYQLSTNCTYYRRVSTLDKNRPKSHLWRQKSHHLQQTGLLWNRLHDVQINIRNNGTEASCGFYKGPADTGDRISVYCVSGTVGRYVQLTILSHVGNFDIFNVCEVQVFVDVEIQD